MLYGREGMNLSVPAESEILRGKHPPAMENPGKTIRAGLEQPIGCAPLRELLRKKKPRTTAITISDITRPVPNKTILPELLKVLNEEGIPDAAVVIVVGTGLHRPSTPEEKVELVGEQILKRIRVVDHLAADKSTVVKVADAPPVFVNKIFVESDFRIVTGLIEPHFMAGYSGGRKGICPALVDLDSVQRFHGHQVMADPHSANGILAGNPCHAESLRIAKTVGCDFLVNVAISSDRRVAGVYAGHMESAHAAGVRDVEQWTTALVEKTFDLVITSGGGYPLDKTFYQTGKGIVSAMEACNAHSTLLIVSQCEEGIGSPSFTEMMSEWSGRWQQFLKHIANTPVKHDQWQVQMMCRAMARVGGEQILLVSELNPKDLRKTWVQSVERVGNAQDRAQQAIDAFLKNHPAARIAVVPEGPYTMLRRMGDTK